MVNEIESITSQSNQSSADISPPKPSFFDNPKKAKRIFILFLILFIIFFLASGAIGYLYWQKDKSLKNANQQNQQNQQIIDKLIKDKADLEKQIADLKKENEDLKVISQQYSETAATKKAIIQAYTEIIAYFAQVLETHGGLSWTEAEYLHARALAQKTQSSSFVATIDWAWNTVPGDPIAKIVRFLREAAAGINENLY